MNGLVDRRARLVDAASGETIAGPDLRRLLDEAKVRLDHLGPGVLLARMAVDVPSIVRYLAAFESGRAIALLDPTLDSGQLEQLVRRFRPAAVVGADPVATVPSGYRAAECAGPAWERVDTSGMVTHPDLAVLLPTSGSTGNPKLVRLSRRAMLANAEAISSVLGIDGDEVAPTSLPLHYSYGLSVLNSHMISGATVVIEASGILGRGFWQAVAGHGATSLAGVPYHYEMLRRMRFDPAKYPTLRTLTQAGGKLAPDRIVEFADKIGAVGGGMFVMYGQTEAAPRMATLPPDQLLAKLGSAGVALPGGAFSIRTAAPDGGTETAGPGVTGEVLYRGPNVMMGYAEAEAELGYGDEMNGVLETGDLGHLDADGYLFITGRLKRIGKVFGNRVSLDDIEQLVSALGPAAAVADGDRVIVWLEGADESGRRAATGVLSERLHLHPSGFDVRGVDALPLLPNGKMDYTSLAART